MSEQGGGQMRREDGTRPVPDPTVLTTEQLLRAIAAERAITEGKIEVLRERLAGIDEATKLRLAGIEGIPAQIDEKVNHLANLMDEKVISIERQFAERDTRAERESRDNKVAVDAAFAAQKEAASEQNKSNTLAIAKSETATTETISKLAELFRTTTDALADKIDDLKERVDRGEANNQGQVQNRTELRAVRTESHSNIQVIVGVVVTVAAIIALMMSLYAAVKPDPAPVQTRIVEVPTQTTTP
jgi:hypothetical protein